MTPDLFSFVSHRKIFQLPGHSQGRTEEGASSGSGAQCLRLYVQATATVEVLKQQCERDALQLCHFQSTAQVCSAAEDDTAATDPQQRAAEAKVLEHLNKAELIRLHNALLLIAERVMETTNSKLSILVKEYE